MIKMRNNAWDCKKTLNYLPRIVIFTRGYIAYISKYALSIYLADVFKHIMFRRTIHEPYRSNWQT